MLHSLILWCSSPLEEYASGRSAVCGTISLDASGSDLLSRLGNEVFALARAGKLALPSFPNFTPLIEALKAGAPTERARALRVTAQRGDSLLILESYVKRWLDHEHTKDRVQEVIAKHNEEFNKTDDALLGDRTSHNEFEYLNAFNFFPNFCYMVGRPLECKNTRY